MIASRCFVRYGLVGTLSGLLIGYLTIQVLLPLNAASLQHETSRGGRSAKGVDQVSQQAQEQDSKGSKEDQANELSRPGIETATFGAGCFWCSEAVFAQLKGVESVQSGYMGGQIKNPTYKQVLTGLTGHAEVVQVKYDANQISFAELLEVFWKTHDPTTLNRQGNDKGTQYRSVVFYHSGDQKRETEHYKKKLTEVKAFRRRIVTQIVPASEFYVAEDYHQDFYEDNPRNRYCRVIVSPKLRKLKSAFPDKLKEDPEKKKKSDAAGSKKTAPKKSEKSRN